MRAEAQLKNKTREEGARGQGKTGESTTPEGAQIRKIREEIGRKGGGGRSLPAGDRKSHRELSHVPSSANACC